MTPTRSPRAGFLVGLAGIALAAAVQGVAPLPGPPLYDGVVTVDPYRFFQPTGSEPGGAQGQTNGGPVSGATSPAASLGTPEQPPQAQVIAGAGALSMPGGTTSLTISITPVAPTVAPSGGFIVGNVYRFSIVNQAGAPITGLPGKQVTIALRDPGSTGIVRIEQLVGGTWQPLPTVSAAVNGTYETTDVTTFGDFALVGTEPVSTGGGTTLSPFAPVTGAVVVLVLMASVVTMVRSRVRRRRR